PGKQQDRTPGRKRSAERLPHQGEHHLQPGGVARPVTPRKRPGPFLRGRASGTPEDPDPLPTKPKVLFPPPVHVVVLYRNGAHDMPDPLRCEKRPRSSS